MLKQELILTEAAWRATAPQTAPSLGHPTNGEPECSTQGGGVDRNNTSGETVFIHSSIFRLIFMEKFR